MRPSFGSAVASTLCLATAALAGGGKPPDPNCTDNGCLRWVTKVGDYGKSDLAPYLAPGAAIDNGYTVYTLGYTTKGREAWAAVTVPYGAKAPEKGWHVAVNCHGTTGLGDACAVVGTVAGTGLAGLFGARGMIGVAIEYPGLGTPGVHPYLVTDVEGPAVLDGLRAIRAFAASKDIPLSGRSAVVGLSQGGHAALAAASMHKAYAPELDIRAFAVAAPASGYVGHWSSAIAFDGPHVAYHALLIHAWAKHYGYQGPPLWAPEVAGTIDETFEKLCTWSPQGEKATLGDKLGTKADKVFSKEFLKAYRSGNWGPYGKFKEWFDVNVIRGYPQTAPLRIYHGDADVVIPEFATKQLVDTLRKGGVEVDYQVVPKGTHLDVAFGFVASKELRTDESIAWVRGKLDAK